MTAEQTPNKEQTKLRTSLFSKLLVQMSSPLSAVPIQRYLRTSFTFNTRNTTLRAFSNRTYQFFTLLFYNSQSVL